MKLSEIEKKFNIFLNFAFNKVAHAFFEEDIQWFFEKLNKHRALYRFGKLNQRIPSLVFDGLVSAEDRRFYEHNGIDFRAITRATWHYLRYGIMEGASTIEQQLTRVITNKYEKSIKRKIREVSLASCICELLPDKKDKEILGIYLSLANFGYEMKGIEQTCTRLGYQIEGLIRPPEVAELIARIKHPEPSKKDNPTWKQKIRRRKNEIASLLLGKLLMTTISEKHDCCLPNSAANRLLIDRYPAAKNFLDAAQMIDEKEKEFLLRGFISEGIPWVFKESPLYYENIRQLIAETLDIHPKDVLITGSRKLGYSLNPDKYGTCVNEQSDLDLVVVSCSLFQKLKKVFLRWGKEYEFLVKTLDLSRLEKKFWENNIKEVPYNIKKGFIDEIKIPARYPLSKNIRSLCLNLEKEINQYRQDDIPRIPENKVSIRIYKDWSSFFKQNVLNIEYLLKDKNEKLKNGQKLYSGDIKDE